MELSLLILAKNEELSLRQVLPPLSDLLASTCPSWEVVLVDGGSKDLTSEVAKQFGAKVLPQEKPGYGEAFRQGVSACKGRYLLTLDADGSHSIEDTRVLLEKRTEADLLIGSRYVQGGRSFAPPFRRLLSKTLNFVFRSALNVPLKDLSSGLRIYNMELLMSVETRARDFDILPEIAYKLYLKGAKIIEVPITFRPRLHGRSKACVGKLTLSYLRTLFSLLALSVSSSRPLSSSPT